MKDTFHTVNPIIRIKENELLTEETFEAMIQANSFEEIQTLLKNTIYEKYLTDNFQFRFESILEKTMTETYQELLDIVSNPDIIWLYTMKYTFHNLKVLTKAEKLGQNYDYLFIPDGFYSLVDVKSAVQTGVSGVLPATVLKAIQDVEDYFTESSIIQGIDVIYDRRYLKEQRRLAETIKDPVLLEAVLLSIDFSNIVTMARCLLQNRTVGFMSTVLSEAGAIKKEELLSYAESSMATFIAFLKKSYLGEAIAPALKEDTIDFLQMDLIQENEQTKCFQIAQTQAFGPLPLVAFMNAKEVELTNLRVLIVGKRSGFTKQQIFERMRNV
ncbi:MAG TPA: V-type ATPase subunit [Candidatus Tetragenococcus pullicola]|nr:V-type ATPase subunit [Candidatus Tetragenococcus pullicola]